MNNSTPPKRLLQFFRWFCHPDFAEDIEGDLHEKYDRHLQKHTKRKAWWLFLWDVLSLFRISLIRPITFHQHLIHPAMFRHNIKITFRNIQRNTSSFLINLIGLSTGLACVLLLFLWVMDEWKIDKFHALDNRLYQVFEHHDYDGDIFTTNSTAWPLYEALNNEMPEVEYAAVATPPYWFSGMNLFSEDKSIRATGQYVGEDYFKLFSFPLLHGDKQTVLSDKSSIILSENVARNLFGSPEAAINQKVNLQKEVDFLVAGVFAALPKQSTLQFDFVLSIEVLKEQHPDGYAWENSGPLTFLVLKEGVDAKQFNDKIENLVSQKSEAKNRKLQLVKYSDNYLHGNFENGKQAGGRIEYLYLFSIIGIFILLIACINFMNLSTAKASRRLKEIGIKKAIGAFRHTLISQYLSESVVISFIALFVAIMMAYLLLPTFNLITGKELTIGFDPTWMGGALVITLITGLIAGSYPALYLSGFKPVDIFKGKMASSLSAIWARKGLVVFQFFISVTFIVLVSVIYMQVSFVQNKNLGYEKENVIYFDIEGKVKENLNTFLSEVEQLPGVAQASSASQSLVGGGNTNQIDWEGKDPNLNLPFCWRAVNVGLIDMLGFELIEGRGFPKELAKEGEVIFNEAGIKAMGMEDPIGKTITYWGTHKATIVGVVKDFHFQSMYNKVEPLYFAFQPEETQKLYLKITAGEVPNTLAQLQQFYENYNPGFELNYRFLDADYQALYASEQKIALLSRYFAGLAILISCLGLFGLAAFTAQRRRKEISIRKVLGASKFSIVRLLGKEFSNMVLAAVILALPLSYYLARNWLDSFAFQIDLKWWLFVGPGGVAILIAWLTVSFQTIRASSVNPAEVLKGE